MRRPSPVLAAVSVCDPVGTEWLPTVETGLLYGWLVAT